MRRVLAILVGIVVPVAAHAQYHLTDSGWSCKGFLYCGAINDVVVILSDHIIAAVVAFIAALATVAILYGAVRIVTSQGQEGKEAGKKAVIWASLGLGAALLTGAVVSFVHDYIYFLGGS